MTGNCREKYTEILQEIKYIKENRYRYHNKNTESYTKFHYSSNFSAIITTIKIANNKNYNKVSNNKIRTSTMMKEKIVVHLDVQMIAITENFVRAVYKST